MPGKRLSQHRAREVFAALGPSFSSDELQDWCAQYGVSYDTLQRKMRRWGWVEALGNLPPEPGARGRPRPMYLKTEKGGAVHVDVHAAGTEVLDRSDVEDGG